eukprot:TRINITY_DN4475_c0_g1_i1.p1 TRINITY_DN4475_c0_g1~~TRINITY_DN4475_c0_g1_i1.p1  ORF type:complete len:209 (-),score=21.78 TRINITY_DN4475_c0_g1_i1:473-1099(-)
MNEITDGAIGIMLIMTLLMLIFFSIHTCLTNKRSSQLLFDWHFHTWLCILGFCFTATFVLAYLVSGASNKFIHGVLDLLLRSIRTPELQIVYLTASITSFLFLYGGQILSYAVANGNVLLHYVNTIVVDSVNMVDDIDAFAALCSLKVMMLFIGMLILIVLIAMVLVLLLKTDAIDVVSSLILLIVLMFCCLLYGKLLSQYNEPLLTV